MKNKLILNQNGISDISVNESEICSTTCDGNEMDTEILEANSNDNREPNQDCAINGEVILISEEGNSSGAENQSTRDISGVSHTVMGDCDISVTQEASISDENVTQNGTELSSKGTDKTVEEKELSSGEKRISVLLIFLHLTLSHTMYFRLFRIERVCRRQFQI